MLCPQKNHNCRMSFFIGGVKKQYICTGINEKPTKWKKDNIWLCLSDSKVKNFTLEMTIEEASKISSALAIVTADAQLRNIKEVKEKVAKKKKGRMVNLRKAKKGKKKAKKSKGKKSKKRR